MSVGELIGGLEHVRRVCGYKEVDIQFDLEWMFDDYYVNVFRDGVLVAEHLSALGDFERVWAWLETNYPEVDWGEQEF